jgi:hypothetical protein
MVTIVTFVAAACISVQKVITGSCVLTGVGGALVEIFNQSINQSIK